MYETKLDSPNLRNYPPTSCVDSAYERKAILEGWKFKQVYPENKQLYDDIQATNPRGSECSECS